MHIQKVEALGLEIWTEYQPEWDTQLAFLGKRPQFIVQSPPLSYPPAAMSYIGFPDMRIDTAEMRDVAASAIRQAAINYQVPAEEREHLRVAPAHYGVLSGYEGRFSGIANGEAVDVLVFVGQKQGKWPVTMQVYTLRGKLPHLSEQIRRAWTHLDYLESAAMH